MIRLPLPFTAPSVFPEPETTWTFMPENLSVVTPPEEERVTPASNASSVAIRFFAAARSASEARGVFVFPAGHVVSALSVVTAASGPLGTQSVTGAACAAAGTTTHAATRAAPRPPGPPPPGPPAPPRHVRKTRERRRASPISSPHPAGVGDGGRHPGWRRPVGMLATVLLPRRVRRPGSGARRCRDLRLAPALARRLEHVALGVEAPGQLAEAEGEVGPQR